MCQPARLGESDRRLGLAVLEAFVREAHLMADLVAQFLEAIGLAPPASERMKKPAEFPREFLRELGFVLRIDTWERAGIRELLAPDLPTARRALDELFVRHGIIHGPPGDPEAGERLSLRVMQVAVGRLALAGREELNADVVVARPDDALLLETFADFAWAHRRAGRAGE
ncbi:MAG TPA: hypothetical protein VGH33_23105 [Isosphaeraceae bacterium]